MENAIFIILIILIVILIIFGTVLYNFDKRLSVLERKMRIVALNLSALERMIYVGKGTVNEQGRKTQINEKNATF